MDSLNKIEILVKGNDNINKMDKKKHILPTIVINVKHIFRGG